MKIWKTFTWVGLGAYGLCLMALPGVTEAAEGANFLFPKIGVINYEIIR